MTLNLFKDKTEILKWMLKDKIAYEMKQIEVRTRYPLDSLHFIFKSNKSKVI